MKNLKIILIAIFAMLFGWAILFSIFAFYNANLNPSFWNEISRAWCALSFFGISACVVLFTAQYFNETK